MAARDSLARNLERDQHSVLHAKENVMITLLNHDHEMSLAKLRFEHEVRMERARSDSKKQEAEGVLKTALAWLSHILEIFAFRPYPQAEEKDKEEEEEQVHREQEEEDLGDDIV